MNSHTFSFVPLLLVIFLAFIVPILLTRFRRIGIPIIVGEILAGMLVGQSGLGLVTESAFLDMLSILGFSLLMFLSGLEVNFSSIFNGNTDKRSSLLQRLLQHPLIFGAILFLLTFGGASIAAFVIHDLDLVSEPWIIALVLSTTSLGVVVPVLKERGFTATSYGQRILSAALVADFASILAISIYVLLRSQGLTLEILLVLVLFAVFFAVHRLTALFQKHLPTEKILEKLATPTSQIKLRGAITLALVFIALAESLGIENILGAFLAGVILSMASGSGSSVVREKLDGIGYGFFIPIFFVMVGVRFDLPSLLSSKEAVLLVPFLVITAYLIKVLPALLFKQFSPWRETIAAGFLLSSRLSLIIAASAIGLELGVISPALNSSIILVAIVTCTLSPIVFNQLMGTTRNTRDRILIVGGHPMVDLLIEQFRNHGVETSRLSLRDIHTPVAEGTDKDDLIPQQVLAKGLRQSDIHKAHTLIALGKTDDENYRICRQALHFFDVENVIALVQDPNRNARFRNLGARIVNMAYSTALIIESMALSKEAFSVAADLDEDKSILEVKLQNPELIGHQISDLELPERVSILLIVRGNELLAPDESTTLQMNDRLTLVGEEAIIKSFAPKLAQNI